MELKKQNILFITRGSAQGGTENVILQLYEILKPHVNKIVVCAVDGFYKEALLKLDIKFYLIPDMEKKSLQIILQIARTIKRIVTKEQISVIHTHHRMAAFYVSLFGLYNKCVFINTSHNTFYDKKLLTRFAYKHANLIACGEMVKKNLVDVFDIPDKQVTVIHNAVKPFDEEIIADPLLKRLHNDGCFVIGNIGRLSKQKGMEYYIKTIPEVIKSHPEARFIIAGNGEDEEKLKKLSEEIGATNYLTFIGYRTDIQNLMSQLDLIVLSSLWEGLPLTPIEAFSVGKTIVATAVDGTVEIVKDGENGLLVESKDVEAIASKICWMIENKEKRLDMEQHAKKTFEKEFSFNVFSNAVLNYYKDIEERMNCL